MFHAVHDGIWVSEKDGVSFHQGHDFHDFVYTKILDEPALKGSAISIDEVKQGDGSLGRGVIFSTEAGIYMGCKGGFIKDLTKGHYGVLGIEEGQAAVVWENGYQQYIFMSQAPAESSGYSGSLTFPALTASGKSS